MVNCPAMKNEYDDDRTNEKKKRLVRVELFRVSNCFLFVCQEMKEEYSLYQTSFHPKLSHCIISQDVVERLVNPQRGCVVIDCGEEKSQGNRRIVFRTKVLVDCVSEKSIVLPFPCKDFMELDNMSSNVHLTTYSDNYPDKIQLRFKRWQCCKNWDESVGTSVTDNNLSWIYSWPTGLQENTLRKLLPSLLAEYLLQSGSAILVKILDSYMVSSSRCVLN
jgi:hypothetical protein